MAEVKETLYLNESMQAAAACQAAAGEAAVFSVRSPEKHDDGKNEDCAGVYNLGRKRAVLAVADGFGGCRGGDQASNIAIKRLGEALNGCSNGNELRSSIIDGFEQANKAVCELGIGAATTLAAVEIQGREVRSYHVGDSLVLIVGQKGKLKLQTIAHSPVGYAVESGVLDEKKAMHHDERHIVSNMLGSQKMHIEVGSPLELSENDTVIVGSDGLFDNLHSEEIVELIRKEPLLKVAEALSSRIVSRMLTPGNGDPSKPDDYSFVLFRL